MSVTVSAAFWLALLRHLTVPVFPRPHLPWLRCLQMVRPRAVAGSVGWHIQRSKDANMGRLRGPGGNFTSVFADRTSFRVKGLRGTGGNRNFTSVFGDRTSFRAKRLRRTTWNPNFTSVFGDRTSFPAKGLRRTTCKSHLYFSFWQSNVISCERVAPDDLKSQFYSSSWRSNLISCERVAPCCAGLEISILPQFLAIGPHFVRKGFVACRLVGAALLPPSREK